MAVPSSAYQSERVYLRSLGDDPIAKFTGAHNTVANAKANFYLDKVFVIRKSGSVYGFLGLVRDGSTNSGRHAASHKARARIRQGGTMYYILNDAGLNLLPRVVVSVVSRWANWTVIRVSISSPHYNPVTSGTVGCSPFSTTYNPGSVSAGTTAERTYTFSDSTSSNSSKYQSGYSYSAKASVSNDQGTVSDSTSFVSAARVLYPRGLVQYFNSSNPTSLDQVSGSREYDIYESDHRLMPRAGSKLYAAPSGSNPPTMTTPLAAGWYHSSDYDEPYRTIAFKLDSTGTVVDFKEISDGQVYNPRIGVRVTIGTDRTDSNCYAIEYSITGAELNVIYSTHDTVRCVIKGANGSNSSTHYAFGLKTQPSGGSTYYAQTNAWSGSGVNITLVLKSKESTQSGSNSYIIRGIGKGSNNGSTWMNLTGRIPGGATNLYSFVISSYCTLQMRNKSTGAWESLSLSVDKDFPVSYVNENQKI